MISYPLIPPASPTTSDIKIMPNNIVGESVSPFTGSQQIFEQPGEWWEAEIALPPMARSDAEQWASFMAALRGKSGSFLLGDPGGFTPQGSASTLVNRLRWTESFDNAIWTKGGGATITANAVASPFGPVVADAFNYPGNLNTSVTQLINIRPSLNGSWTFSVWLRIASGTLAVQLGILDQNGSTFPGGSAIGLTVTSSWTRFSVTGIAPTSATALTAIIGGFNSLNGIAAGTIYCWGAQMEKAASASSYLAFDVGPCVNGAGQTGKTLNVQAFNIVANQVGFKAGDYIEIGSGTTQRLYKNLTDVTFNGSGQASLDLFPRLRESPADQAQVRFFDCRGSFRLAENPRSWDIGNDGLYRPATLKCKEAF
jgi:hypothetical protein